MLLFRSFDDNSLRLDTVTQYTVESVQLFSSLKRLNLTNQPNLQNLRPAVGTVILSPTVNIISNLFQKTKEERFYLIRPEINIINSFAQPFF